ncbi:DUF7919 family protein [Paenibacillus xylaniclasticus]|uniref:DUF7919 family protein n=1 Tax=Paenibacillus xylaniclasticus TaxID=588083 RepID=UPI00176DF54D|nr:hypothetical protein PCURB6_12230 [Paenibacillus curdlanolyticus]
MTSGIERWSNIKEYFKDLTYYSLHQFENAQNIGWIDVTNDSYVKGDIPDDFIENLELYTKHPFHETRGNMNSI